MRLICVLALGLVLAAQPSRAPQRNLDGYWWIRATKYERMIYQQGFADGGGRIGPASAIDKFYANPAALDVPLAQGIRTIWGEAEKLPAPSLG